MSSSAIKIISILKMRMPALTTSLFFWDPDSHSLDVYVPVKTVATMPPLGCSAAMIRCTLISETLKWDKDAS